jgi:hypothetical protein
VRTPARGVGGLQPVRAARPDPSWILRPSHTMNRKPVLVLFVGLDWLYMRDGKMVGNETLKPLLKKMPAAEVNRLKSIKAEP